MSDLAVVAEALENMSKAKALAAIGSPEGRTCAGCVAYDRNCKHCEPLRRAELCQKQVYLRVALARLVVELVCALAVAGVDEAAIHEAVTRALATPQWREVTDVG
jgi:hypothetical protein